MENEKFYCSDISSQYHDTEYSQKCAAAGDCTGGLGDGGPNVLTEVEFCSSI